MQTRVDQVVKKYSNFVGVPIKLNGEVRHALFYFIFIIILFTIFVRLVCVFSSPDACKNCFANNAGVCYSSESERSFSHFYFYFF